MAQFPHHQMHRMGEQQPPQSHSIRQPLCSQRPQQTSNSPYFVFNTQQTLGPIPLGIPSGLYVTQPNPAEVNTIGPGMIYSANGCDVNDGGLRNATPSTIPMLSSPVWMPSPIPVTDSTQQLNSSVSTVQFPSSNMGCLVPPPPSGASTTVFENLGFLYSMPVPAGSSINPDPSLMVAPSQPGKNCLYFMPNASPMLASGISQQSVGMRLNSTTSGTRSGSTSVSSPPTQYQYSSIHTPQPSGLIGVPWSIAPQNAPARGHLILLTDPQVARIDPAVLPSQGGSEFSHSTVGIQAPPQILSRGSSSVKAPGRRTPNRDASVSPPRKEASRSGNLSKTAAQSPIQDKRLCGLSYEEDPSPIDTTKKQLIVNFLPQCVRSEELFTLFSQFGEQHKSSTKVVIDRNTRRSKGYGFVYYKDGRSTDLAIKTMNGFELHGRRIKVRYADQQRDTREIEDLSSKNEEETNDDGGGDCGGVSNLEHCLSTEEDISTAASTYPNTC